MRFSDQLPMHCSPDCAVAATGTIHDAIIVGGGPAGSTIAALLAERGRDVVLLEKSAHPRFHIGESLLPLNLPLFERLGVAGEIRAIGMPKYGAELVSPWHERPVSFDFDGAIDKSFPLAYQVRRSEFDHILFRNAVRRGAHAVERCRATSVEFKADRVVVTSRDKQGERTWHARFLIDASGRDTLLANHFGMKRRNRKHASAALFGHFAGAERLPGRAEGNITIFWFDYGWFWFIPLSDGTTSVGAVCAPGYMKSRTNEPRQFLLDTIERCPALAQRLRPARLVSDVTATGNYSYVAEKASGRNHILIGDAYTFIDPVFSTGVYLAMESAFAGAETVETCLDTPAAAPRALNAFDARMRHGPSVYSWFIYRLTTPAFRDLFMDPRNVTLQEGVLSLMAGDVFRDTPIGWRLSAFKALYYMASLAHPVKALFAWRKRRINAQEGVA
jgi:flavin-dependent dehydrogenase